MALRASKTNAKKQSIKANKKRSIAWRAKAMFRWRAILYFIIFILWGLISLLLVFALLAKEMPDLEAFANQSRNPVITVKDQAGTTLAVYGNLHGQSLTFGQLPSQLIDALIAVEDKRFFSHPGLDIFGIIRAYFVNLKAGKIVQGGSTITQQLAKIAYLTPERNFKRKILELMIALQLERKFSKEQIISMYLNRVYMGRGLYGIDSASQFYFGKDPSEITLFEAAMLAGMVQAPSRFSPAVNPQKAIARAKIVLSRMVDEDMISPQQARQAEPPIIVQHGIGRGALKNPYFTDYVLQELNQLFENVNQDVTVVTTLDLNLQNALEGAISKQINTNGAKYNVSEAAGLSIQPNGAIKAMVGGVDYAKSTYNRAVYAKRQTGSAFKFFVYAAALEAGYTINDILIDEPIEISLGKGRKLWQPRNYDRKYRGEMSLQDAFAYSINTIAVQLSENVGRANVIATARDLGITSDLPNLPSLALGVADASLSEMVRAFASVANEGYLVEPFAVLNVYLADGSEVYSKHKNEDIKVLSDQTVSDMKALLSSSVDYGTSKAARMNGQKIYGKTGTTQEHRDAWFIGFNSSLVTGVWVGNDDNLQTKGVVGGTMPAWIWRDYMAHLPSNISVSLPDYIHKKKSIFDIFN